MSEKSFGFKMRLGINNIKSFITIFNLISRKINKAIEAGDITPEHNFTGIKLTNNQDYSYTITFYFDDEFLIEEI